MGIIDVRYNELSNIARNLASNLEAITEAKNSATLAGQSAVLAAGGKTTPVGKAVSDSLADLTDSQFDDAIKVMNDLIDAISKVATVYTKENDELLTKIQKIAQNNTVQQ